MAYFFRLIAFLVCFVPLSSFAQVYEFRAGSLSAVGGWNVDPLAAANSWKGAAEAKYPGVCSPNNGYSSKYVISNIAVPPGAEPNSFTYSLAFQGFVPSTCAPGSTGAADPNNSGSFSKRLLSCPANAAATPSGCTCNAGYSFNSDATSCLPIPQCDPPKVLNGTVCEDPPDECEKLDGSYTVNQRAIISSLSNDDFPVCSTTIWGKCSGTFDTEMSAGQDGKFYAWGTVRYTSSSTCTVGTDGLSGGGAGPQGDPAPPPPTNPVPPPSNPPPDPPPPGKCPGTVNGVEVLVTCGSSSTSTTTNNTTNNTDGSGSSTQTNDETKCVGSTCTTTTTTTTTTTDSQGGTTSSQGPTSTTEQDKGGFCEANPRDPHCGDGGGSFGGSCAASFQCGGDALLCAISKEQYTRNCQLFETPSDASNLYDTEKGKIGSVLGELAGNETVSIGANSFDSSDALVGGSCISDLNITVRGSAISLPFSRICPYLVYLGYILQAVAFLLAGRILIRG